MPLMGGAGATDFTDHQLMINGEALGNVPIENDSDVDDDEDTNEGDNKEPSFEDECAQILETTGLLKEETTFEFAPKGSETRKQQEAAIYLGILQLPPKYSDSILITRAVASFYQQYLLLKGDLKDYCALMCTLLLVIFPSTNPDDLEMSVRLLAYLEKSERFYPYGRFVKGSVLDPTVKKRVTEITSFWTQTLGTGVFGLCACGFNYNNMHRTAEQICDMRDDNDIADFFLGFFLQWLPHRQKRLDFCASRWHKNAERSFGYAATLLFNGMK